MSTLLGRFIGHRGEAPPETRGQQIHEHEGPLTAERMLAGASWVGDDVDPGAGVTNESAMRASAVYRAIALMAGTGAQLPLKAYNDGPSRSRAHPPLLTNPCPGITPFGWHETVFAHLLSWGNHYSLKVRDSRTDRIVALKPLAPALVHVAADPSRVTRLNALGKTFTYHDDNGRERVVGPHEIWHAVGLSLDGLTGLSPIGLARRAIGLGLMAESLGGKMMAKGTHLGGVLKTEAQLTREQADAIKEQWRIRVAGADHAGEIAVLDSGASYESLGVPASDLQWIEARRFQVEEIARLYGIPPHLLGATDKTTSFGAGIESLNRAMVTYALGPWLGRVEGAWSELLNPPGKAKRWAEHDTNGLLRGDSTARFSAYGTAIAAGWLSPNEVRAFENLPPIDGLDEYSAPSTDPPPPPAPEPTDQGTQPNESEA